MSKKATDTKSETQVGPKLAIDMKDDELEKVFGGTSDAKLASDSRTESAGTQGTTSRGHFSQMQWG